MTARPPRRSPGRRLRHCLRHRLPLHAPRRRYAQREQCPLLTRGIWVQMPAGPRASPQQGQHGLGSTTGASCSRPSDSRLGGLTELAVPACGPAFTCPPCSRRWRITRRRPSAGSAARGDQHALAIGDKAAASRVLPGAAANCPIQLRVLRPPRRSHPRRKRVR
jgi:hypothetical protein